MKKWKKTKEGGNIVYRRAHLAVERIIAGAWQARFDGTALRNFFPDSRKARRVLDSMPSREEFWGGVSKELDSLCKKR